MGMEVAYAAFESRAGCGSSGTFQTCALPSAFCL